MSFWTEERDIAALFIIITTGVSIVSGFHAVAVLATIVFSFIGMAFKMSWTFERKFGLIFFISGLGFSFIIAGFAHSGPLIFGIFLCWSIVVFFVSQSWTSTHHQGSEHDDDSYHHCHMFDMFDDFSERDCKLQIGELSASPRPCDSLLPPV
jgi:hypothetical protein